MKTKTLEVRRQTSEVRKNGMRCALPVSPTLLFGGLLSSSLNLISDVRLLISVFGALLFALCPSAEAQQAKKVPRVGFIASTYPADRNLEAFREGLRGLGYIDGKNILVEYRYSEGKDDRLPSFVSDCLQSKVDILVSSSSPAIRAAKEAASAIPIVMITTIDPVATGLIDSLARPGGNITGLTRLTRELSGKRLELFREVVPRISRIGVLWTLTNAPEAGLRDSFQFYEAAAQTLEMQVQSLEVHGPDPDIEGAFRDAIKARINGLVTLRTGVLLLYSKRIAELALKNRLPSLHEGIDNVEAGGLMSYAASDADLFRRAAVYVDKIIKGARPADLPVEQPTKFELVINLKTAKQLGLTIPPSVLARADKVIK